MAAGAWAQYEYGLPQSACDVSLQAAYAIWQIDGEATAPARVCREALNSRDAATSGWTLVYLSAIQPNEASLMP